MIAALAIGCGSGEDTSTTHNDQDIAFAQGMIPHHRQAVDMADMAAEQATTTEVKELAARIAAAQEPEIRQLTGMLEQWGAPAGPSTGHDGMDHGEGMMSGDDMRQLESATGAAFDRMWVRLMIEHHEGAVAMSRTELARGASQEAKDLARKIIDAQEAEIEEMRALTP